MNFALYSLDFGFSRKWEKCQISFNGVLKCEVNEAHAVKCPWPAGCGERMVFQCCSFVPLLVFKGIMWVQKCIELYKWCFLRSGAFSVFSLFTWHLKIESYSFWNTVEVYSLHLIKISKSRMFEGNWLHWNTRLFVTCDHVTEDIFWSSAAWNVVSMH